MGNADSLNQFTEQIRALHEIDYGDFKRKAVLYIGRFQQRLDPDQLRATQELLKQMHALVLYGGTARIEKTREQLLDLADQVRERLGQRH
jgi:hypothetical protein